MQKRSYLYVLLIALFLIALTTPVIAQDSSSFSHTIDYKIGGLITIDRQLGHACTTGAVKKQTVRGYGDMTKSETVRIAANIITVDEKMDWSTAADALGGLTVTTIIDLCSRPMSAAAETYTSTTSPAYTVYKDDIINVYFPPVVSGDIDVYGLTGQIWVTQVMTNPGHNGSYHSDFIAAYGPGPYERAYGAIDPDDNVYYYDEEFMWDFDDTEEDGIKRGDYYVGNYFNIDQYAYTSGGALKRYFSMSNPFENTYLREDLTVTGMASVRETFEMNILEGGPKAITLAWYDLF